jgi:hypothetical protein
MTYCPAAIYNLRYPDDVKKVALARGLDEKDQFYLLTGGARPMLVHLTGQYAGHGFEVQNASRKPLLIVEDVEFEIDPESIYKLAHVQEPIGAFIITDTCRGITVERGNPGGLTDVVDVYFDDPHDGSCRPGTAEAGFKKWRVIKRVNEQTIELLSFEASRTGDR